ncbi:hypothetical protein SVAN01_03562 [Stagonosporopsis vannaccii]|nr:hypothetical protein SVAN01_03562 [Stagonosporopsis vannaccii]
MVPAPYNVRWTAQLIRRDLKAIAADFTSRVRNVFLRKADVAASISQDEVEDGLPIDTKDSLDIASTSTAFTTTAPTSSAPASFTPANSATSFLSTAADSDANAPTEVANSSLDSSTTLYGLLSTKLKDLYASRHRELPLNERWLFRGAWLILDMATQHCASNPSHDDISEPGSSRLSETALVLGVLQHSVAKPLHLPPSRVSQMPAMPHTKHSGQSTRQDSVFSTVSDQPHPSAAPALLWYTIFAGASDQAMTVHAAETLISHAWAEKDATAVLEVVGNPAKRLSEHDESELRRRFGRILHAQHNMPY